jgi:excisionase family DNA binding protein
MKNRKIESLGNGLVDFVTITEAAEIRGVSRASVHELVQRGRLRSVRMFGRVLLYRDEVESFKKAKPGPKNKA